MIYNGIGRLTEENYKAYLNRERKFYTNYNYQFDEQETDFSKDNIL